MSKARVSLVHGGDRRTNVFNALELVRADVESRLAEQVMLKPNFLSSDNQLASSHADALRGVLDFLLTTPRPPREVLIAEGGAQDTWDAYRNFGYHALEEEYSIPLRLLDLHRETEWESTPIVLADGTETIVRMPRTVLDCPCTISLAIPKTHDTCVVTLALKNMIMGTIYQQDRVKMHGFNTHGERRVPDESRAMSINLIRLARFMTPDVAVIDGARGLQGNGPGGTDGLDFGIAAASTRCLRGRRGHRQDDGLRAAGVGSAALRPRFGHGYCRSGRDRTARRRCHRVGCAAVQTARDDRVAAAVAGRECGAAAGGLIRKPREESKEAGERVLSGFIPHS